MIHRCPLKRVNVGFLNVAISASPPVLGYGAVIQCCYFAVVIFSFALQLFDDDR